MVQQLRSKNENKDDQILLLHLDVKYLRELEKTFEKQKNQSKLAEKSLKDLSQLRQSYKELKAMMEETLNVKLRYEEIIKSLISNEEKGSNLSVVEVVAMTQAKTKVQIAKTEPKNKISSLTVSVT